jgi:prevent-host-death family protein
MVYESVREGEAAVMTRSRSKTQSIKVSEARTNLASLLNRVFREQERVIIEKSGIPIAAIVSTDDLRRLERLDEELEARRALLEEIRAPFSGIPESEIEREVEQALAEVRAERRATKNAPPLAS